MGWRPFTHSHHAVSVKLNSGPPYAPTTDDFLGRQAELGNSITWKRAKIALPHKLWANQAAPSARGSAHDDRAHMATYMNMLYWGTDVPNCWQRCNRFSLILIICVCRQPLAGICAGAAPSNPYSLIPAHRSTAITALQSKTRPRQFYKHSIFNRIIQCLQSNNLSTAITIQTDTNTKKFGNLQLS